MVNNNLNGKVALVTAGAAGIGRVIADDLLKQGAIVHVCDIATEALASLPESDRLFKSQIDVSNDEQVAGLLQQITDQQGRLDILVNNAGIAGPALPVEQIGIADWKNTLAVDLDSVFYVTRYAIPLLKASDRAAIINMSSNAGLSGLPLRSAYVAAKWAIIGLTKTWAMELGSYGICVNALCPGSVEGPRIDKVIERDAATRGINAAEVRKVYEHQSSLRRFVRAQDIADMVSYLVGEAGRNISGQAIGIDGHTESMANWLDQ